MYGDQSSAEHLAERIHKGTRQTAGMKRGLELCSISRTESDKSRFDQSMVET